MPNLRNTKPKSLQQLQAEIQLEEIRREELKRQRDKNDADYEAQQLQLEIEAARLHLLNFTKLIFPDYIPLDYHRQIAEALEAVERGEVKRLLITIPPQHGKSTLASKAFPTWYLARNPNNRIILGSYGSDQADEFGYAARNIISDRETFGGIFPNVDLAKDSHAKNAWDLAKPNRGGFRAVGVGGPVTGKSANLILLDDLVKGVKEADSPTDRENVWRWYLRNCYTRISSLGAIVLIMTRWNEDDVAGRILRNDTRGKWHVLHIKALTEDTETGELRALWPERYPVDYLLEIKENDPRGFAALYQGEPTVSEGNIFKREWFSRRYQLADLAYIRFTRKVMSVDGGFKTGVANDYSAIAIWATNGIDYYPLYVWRQKVELPELKTTIIDLYYKFTPDIVLVEDAASGIPAIQEIKRETSIPIIGVPTRGASKISRAEANTPIFRTGKVLLPEGAEWLSDWIEEHLAFPQATHDDQVDTTSLALAELKSNSGQEAPQAGGERVIVYNYGKQGVPYNGLQSQQQHLGNGFQGQGSRRYY